MNSPQPVVSVLCQLNSITDGNDTQPIQFPDRYVIGCDGANSDCSYTVGHPEPSTSLHYGLNNLTDVSRADIWNQLLEDPQGRIIWIDDISVSSPFNGTALGVIIIQPERCSDGPDKTFLSTSACVIGATWSNMTTFVQTQLQKGQNLFNSAIQTELSQTTFSTLDWSHPEVKLSKAWAEGLNPSTETKGRTVVDNLLRWMPLVSNICPQNGAYKHIDLPLIQTTQVIQERPFMHEALLASLVANGLAYPFARPDVYLYVDYSAPKWEKIAGSDIRSYVASPRGLILQVHAILPGYAHEHSGVPIKIALGVLLLYVLFASGFALYTVHTGQSDLTWSSIAELTALAINSSPTQALENTSAGIGQVETIRKTVSVREVETNGRLELVFDGDEDSQLHRRVVVGRSY